jgi:hypothetical protein
MPLSLPQPLISHPHPPSFFTPHWSSCPQPQLLQFQGAFYPCSSPSLRVLLGPQAPVLTVSAPRLPFLRTLCGKSPSLGHSSSRPFKSWKCSCQHVLCCVHGSGWGTQLYLFAVSSSKMGAGPSFPFYPGCLHMKILSKVLLAVHTGKFS